MPIISRTIGKIKMVVCHDGNYGCRRPRKGYVELSIIDKGRDVVLHWMSTTTLPPYMAWLEKHGISDPSSWLTENAPEIVAIATENAFVEAGHGR